MNASQRAAKQPTSPEGLETSQLHLTTNPGGPRHLRLGAGPAALAKASAPARRILRFRSDKKTYPSTSKSALSQVGERAAAGCMSGLVSLVGRPGERKDGRAPDANLL